MCGPHLLAAMTRRDPPQLPAGLCSMMLAWLPALQAVQSLPAGVYVPSGVCVVEKLVEHACTQTSAHSLIKESECVAYDMLAVPLASHSTLKPALALPPLQLPLCSCR